MFRGNACLLLARRSFIPRGSEHSIGCSGADGLRFPSLIHNGGGRGEGEGEGWGGEDTEYIVYVELKSPSLPDILLEMELYRVNGCSYIPVLSTSETSFSGTVN